MDNNNSKSKSNSNSRPNNLRNLAQKQARRRIVGAGIFAVLVIILLPFLMDNSHNQMLDEVAVNIPHQNADNKIAQTTQPADNDVANNGNSEISENGESVENHEDDGELNIPAVATSLNNYTPEEENQAVTARIIQKQDKEKQKLTSQNQQKMIAEDKENKVKAEKARLAKLEKEKAERAAKEKAEKEKAKNKNDDSKRAASILAGNFDEPKKPETKTESKNANQKYIISIGAFSDENNVKNLLKKLADLKIVSYTESIDGGKKIRVRAGPFTSEKDAQNALNKMQGGGISGKISAMK